MIFEEGQLVHTPQGRGKVVRAVGGDALGNGVFLSRFVFVQLDGQPEDEPAVFVDDMITPISALEQLGEAAG